MNRVQINGRIKQVKGRDVSSKFLRDGLLGKNARLHKPIGRIPADYDAFKDFDFNDLDPDVDIRGYGDFRDDVQKSG